MSKKNDVSKKKLSRKGRILLLSTIIAMSLLIGFGVYHHTLGQPSIPPIEVIKLKDNLYLMNDNGEASGYILLGSKKAAVIDTMNGRENVYDVVRTVTDLPLVVINTHGHIDHMSGDGFFDEVYLHPDDNRLIEETMNYPQYKRLKRQMKLGDFAIKPMSEGDVFDLGGVKLEVFDCPGHTKGSVCLLDREDRVLFSGDSINRHCWMQVADSTSLEQFYTSLGRLEAIRGEYDTIYCGHTTTGDDASLYDEHMAAVKEVIDGVGRESDGDYTYFGGVCKIHQYTEGNVAIVYNE